MEICHKTGSASNSWVQLCVPQSAVACLVAKGDYLGACRNKNAREEGTAPSVDNEFVAYPNPAHDLLNVDFNSAGGSDYVIRVIDITGRILLDKSVASIQGQNHLEFNTGSYAKGLYILTFTSGGENRQVRVVLE